MGVYGERHALSTSLKWPFEELHVAQTWRDLFHVICLYFQIYSVCPSYNNGFNFDSSNCLLSWIDWIWLNDCVHVYIWRITSKANFSWILNQKKNMFIKSTKMKQQSSFLNVEDTAPDSKCTFNWVKVWAKSQTEQIISVFLSSGRGLGIPCRLSNKVTVIIWLVKEAQKILNFLSCDPPMHLKYTANI